jgi:hypothetical protein
MGDVSGSLATFNFSDFFSFFAEKEVRPPTPRGQKSPWTLFDARRQVLRARMAREEKEDDSIEL